MTKSGLVAFFDILGYQNIIDNNKIEDVAKIISDTLDQLPKKTESRIFGALAGKGKKGVRSLREVFKDMHTLLISDSILITFPVSKGLSNDRIASH